MIQIRPCCDQMKTDQLKLFKKKKDFIYERRHFSASSKLRIKSSSSDIFELNASLPPKIISINKILIILGIKAIL